MSWLDGLRERARTLAHRGAVEREMDEELRFHLEREVERGLDEGLSAQEARRRAVMLFGGVEGVREAVRSERGWSWLEDLLRESVLSLRALRRRPTFAIAVLLTLALGLGAAIAIFSVVDGVLLRPLPFSRPSELVVTWETDRDSGTQHEPSSVPDYLDFRDRARSLSALAAFRGAQVNVGGGEGDPERLDALAVSADLPGLLGVAPRLGRAFTADDDRTGAAPVVLLGEECWRRRFAADPGIVGRRLDVDGVATTVIGVMPATADHGLRRVLAAADYGDPFTDSLRQGVDVWLPLAADPVATPRFTHPILLLGRLAAGSSPQRAGEELAAIAADLEATYPENAARGSRVEPLREVVIGPLRRPLMALLVGVALVLLVACVNVAQLLLERSVARAPETAVRRALGAADRQLLRQFLVEAGWLTLGAAVGGVACGLAALAALRRLAPADLPGLRSVGLEPGAVLVALAVGGLVLAVFATLPWLHLRRRPLVSDLATRSQRGSAGSDRGRAGLVVAELAVAVVLTLGAGVVARQFWGLAGIDPGFGAAGLVKAQFQLPASRYPQSYANWPQWREVHGFEDALLARLVALPGVESAALAAVHPLDRGFTNSFLVVGREAEAAAWPELPVRPVSASYFTTLGVPVVDGRAFGDGDGSEAAPVAMVNQAAVRRFFPGQRPLGQRIGLWGRQWRIVGVAGDERFHGLQEDAPPALYLPLAQAPSGNGVALVRVAGEPAAQVAAVSGAIRATDPALAVYGAEPLADTLSRSLAEPRFVLRLATLFAGLALFLAAIGVHGLLTYRVSLRIPELGVRMALGASRGRVLRRVVAEGVTLAAAGVLVGTAGAFAAGRLVGGLVYGLEVRLGGAEVLTLLIAGALVLTVAVVASLAPARRATGADPLRALRAQ